MCSFLHIHTSQGSPKASFSWCFLFNTSTHHRVHQKRVPADVSFSTQPHITGFTKYVFQLVCPFQHIHILQGLPKAFSSWCVIFNTSTHHWVHQRRVPAVCPFPHNHGTYHRVHQRRFPAGVSFSTQPRHISQGSPKACSSCVSFSTQPRHISQGSPKAFSSWCVLFHTTTAHITGFTKGVFQLVCPFPHNHGTYHRVYQRRFPAGVSFSTQPHITGFIKRVFQLVCPFQHNHTSQGSSKRVPAGVSFSTHPHITGFIKSMFQLVCPFLHIHTSQGAPKVCSSWCVISSHP